MLFPFYKTFSINDTNHGKLLLNIYSWINDLFGIHERGHTYRIHDYAQRLCIWVVFYFDSINIKTENQFKIKNQIKSNHQRWNIMRQSIYISEIVWDCTRLWNLSFLIVKKWFIEIITDFFYGCCENLKTFKVFNARVDVHIITYSPVFSFFFLFMSRTLCEREVIVSI